MATPGLLIILVESCTVCDCLFFMDKLEKMSMIATSLHDVISLLEMELSQIKAVYTVNLAIYFSSHFGVPAKWQKMCFKPVRWRLEVRFLYFFF